MDFFAWEGAKALDPKATTILKDNISCHYPMPAANTTPWQLEGTVLALKKAGLTVGQVDLIELHEAFAAQTLANLRELGIAEKDYDRVNVNGSCVSIGHPLGATGARILITLLNEMKRRKSKYGMFAICGGGGMGVSGILERI